MTARYWKRPRAVPGSYHWAQLNRKAESRFARLLILDVQEWDGLHADKKFAEKEGYQSSTEFLFSYWHLIDHKRNETDRKHYKIEFEVVDMFQPTPPIEIDGVTYYNKDFINYTIHQPEFHW